MDNNSRINVEALERSLLKRATSRPRFKIPLSYDDTVRALTTAVRAEVLYRHRTPSLPPMMPCIEQAAHWLTSDEKFGLALMGTTGNGKTTLAKAIRALVSALNMRDGYDRAYHFRMSTAKDIVVQRQNNYEGYKAMAHTPLLIIDDFGEEPAEVLDYGNALNPVIDLLSIRYEEQLTTIITTNISNSNIRNVYGDRIADRFNEMMKVIIFTNNSYRQ